MPETKKLNRFEVWVADHSAPIFLVIASLIVVGAIAVFYSYEKQGDTAEQVQVLQPEVTKINQAICDARSLKDRHRAERCAERIRVGLINCRRVERCRAALLAAITYPPPARSAEPLPNLSKSAPGSGQPGGGDAVQSPSSKGHQQPGPHEGGGQGRGQQGGQEPGAKSPEATSQAEDPAPAEDTATDARHPAAEAVEHVEGKVHEVVGDVTKEVGAAAEGAVCGSLAAPNCTK